MNREIVCDEDSIPGVHALRTPVVSADGAVVTFLGAPSTNGSWSVYAYRRADRARRLVSITTNGTPAVVPERSEPAISPDGHRVAYESADPAIVADDLNEASDIFVRDMVTGTTVAISVASVPAATGSQGRGSAAGPGSVSALGKEIAFASLANNLAPSDVNSWQDVVFHERLGDGQEIIRGTGGSGSTRLGFAPAVSFDGRYVAWYEQDVPQSPELGLATNLYWLDRKSGATKAIIVGGVSHPSAAPALSRDGRWLAFAEQAPGSLFTNVYLRDLHGPEGTHWLVSQSRFGPYGANGHSGAPQISPDGVWVVFFSRGADAAVTPYGGVTLGRPLLFARNRVTGEARWVSRPPTGPEFTSINPIRFSLTSNGRYVAFDAQHSIYFAGFIHDLAEPDSTKNVCTPCTRPTASDDGRIVAYEQTATPLAWTQVWFRDDLTGQATLTSANVVSGLTVDGNGGAGNSTGPVVSTDGRYIAFASAATNLVSDDTNGVIDVFVYDRALRAVILVSRGPDGAVGDGPSTQPFLAPDGRTIVFNSFAANLVPGDFNNARDVFVVRLGGPDMDFDGLDDQWELSHFGDLNRDGGGDFDDDGSTDWEEHRGGTDPTNGQSIFKILATSYAMGNTRVVVWNAEPGRTYRIQYKRFVTDPVWRNLPGSVTATGSTGSYFDSSTPTDATRFYRVTFDQ